MPRKPTNNGIESRAKIFNYIKSYCLANNVPPSLNDIEFDIGMSKSSIHYHLQVMIEAGVIKQVGKSKYIPGSLHYVVSE